MYLNRLFLNRAEIAEIIVSFQTKLVLSHWRSKPPQNKINNAYQEITNKDKGFKILLLFRSCLMVCLFIFGWHEEASHNGREFWELHAGFALITFQNPFLRWGCIYVLYDMSRVIISCHLLFQFSSVIWLRRAMYGLLRSQHLFI